MSPDIISENWTEMLGKLDGIFRIEEVRNCSIYKIRLVQLNG